MDDINDNLLKSLNKEGYYKMTDDPVVKELQNYIERIEKLQDQKSELGKDISVLFKKAKNEGFDPKAMREIIKLRKQDAHEVTEFENNRQRYKTILL